MASRRARAGDALYQALKRLQRRYLLADYEDLRLLRGWARAEPSAAFEERVFPVQPQPGDVRSVLVFKVDEIGDAVQALPAIAELRRCLPAARLFCLCRPLTKPLFERTGLFDEISAYEPGSRLVPARRRVAAALKRFSQQEFDLSVFLKTYPATFHEYLSVPARLRLHPLDPRLRSRSVHRARVSLWGDERRHQALQLLEIVSHVSGRSYSHADVAYPELRWTPEDEAAVEAVFGKGEPPPFVVVHPFAKHETRRYPPEYWPSLLAALACELRGVTWVSIGSGEDGPLPPVENLVQAQGRLTLMQTAFLLTAARGFVGNISGPAHLSAALGTPTVTLMSGYQLAAEWAPLGDSLVIRADVPCAPCARSTCPLYGLACLRELTPERIAPEIAAFLKERVEARRPTTMPALA